MPEKKPRCTHQWPEIKQCQPAFLNTYRCDHCDEDWEDTWSCAVDTECPKCGKDTSPDTSEQIAECACAAI